MRRRAMLALGALAVTAALGASCSGSTSGSANGAATTAAAAQAVRFSTCMRDHGVAQFPDPSASGELTIEAVANGTSIDPNSEAFTRALSACKDLEPSGFTGHRRTTEQQQAALRFAQCVRDNGVKDFPDPTPDGPIVDTTRIPSLAGKDPRRSALTTAMQTCRSLSTAAGVTGP